MPSIHTDDRLINALHEIHRTAVEPRPLRLHLADEPAQAEADCQTLDLQDALHRLMATHGAANVLRLARFVATCSFGEEL